MKSFRQVDACRKDHTNILSMKRILFLSFLLSFCVNICHSQTKVRLTECLEVENVEDSLWLIRYEKDIARFVQEDKSVRDVRCDALFLGSSSFRLWGTIKEDFAPLKIVNHGYGGASIRDLLYNYRRIVGPYQPKHILYYAENDIIGSEKDISISQTFDLCRLFFERIHRDFPGVPLYILSVKPSYARWELFSRHTILNGLLKEYAEQTPNTTFLDVTTPLLDADGELRPELYLKDNLHLNKEGYKIWTSIIKPYLMAP